MAIQETQRLLREQGGFRRKLAARFLGGARIIGEGRTREEWLRSQMVPFSDVASESLRDQDHFVIPLTGETIRSLLDQRSPIRPEVLKRFDATGILDQPAIHAEVAIRPHELLLTDTRGSFPYMISRIGEHSLSQSREIPGTKLIMPSATDLAVLTIKFLNFTGAPLFGMLDNLEYGATKTNVDKDTSVSVGNFETTKPEIDKGLKGLDISTYPISGASNVHAVRFIVPSDFSDF